MDKAQLVELASHIRRRGMDNLVVMACPNDEGLVACGNFQRHILEYVRADDLLAFEKFRPATAQDWEMCPDMDEAAWDIPLFEILSSEVPGFGE